MVRSILVVDDDRDDQEILEESVRNIDPTLTCNFAVNGMIALEFLKTTCALPELIFLDLNMPVMDGKQFLAAKNEICALKTIPTIVLTTSDNVVEKNAVSQLGATEFYTKPASYKCLQQAIYSFLLKYHLISQPVH